MSTSRVISGLAVAVLGFVLALAGAAAGKQPDRTLPAAGVSIVGGEPASIESLPSLAYIEASSKQSETVSSCTGTVVAPQVILTAGHCVQSLETGRINSPAQYAVATGIADVRAATATEVHLVSRVLAFPQFSLSTLRGDAGLLILATPTTAPAMPMARVADTQSLGPGSPLQIAGWGLTDGRGKRSSPVLQTAATVMQAPDFCALRTRSFYPYYLPARQLCALDSPAHLINTCKGDSGGPAIARRPDGSPFVVGITSLGAANCNPRKPSVFTRVDQVVEWVDEWIAASEGLAPAPPIPAPNRRLPFLSTPLAQSLAAVAFREDFGHRFKRGREKRIGCRRIEREKVKCGVSWYQGPNDYWGTITVFLTVSENEFVWDARYRIRWVNNRCWFQSGDRQSCVIHTKSR